MMFGSSQSQNDQEEGQSLISSQDSCLPMYISSSCETQCAVQDIWKVRLSVTTYLGYDNLEYVDFEKVNLFPSFVGKI